MIRRAGLATVPWRVLALVGSLLVFGLPSPAAEAAGDGEEVGQAGSLWNLGELASGRVYPTTLTAFNRSCRGRRHFEFTVEDAPWLRITGPRSVGVRRGERESTDAVIDLQGVAPGERRGKVTISCLDCPPMCRQDYTVIDVRLTVVAGEPSAPASDVFAELWEQVDITRKPGSQR